MASLAQPEGLTRAVRLRRNTDEAVRALERRVAADPTDLMALKRLVAARDRMGDGDPAAEARAISRDLYWLDVRRIAEQAWYAMRNPATSVISASRPLIEATGRLRGPEEQGEVLAHSHWRSSRDADEAILHDIASEVERLADPILDVGDVVVRLPEHGARVETVRQIRRDWFKVPAGATGTVTTSSGHGIGMRLDDDLRGAAGDDFDNTVMWLDDDLAEFWRDVRRIG